MSQDGSAPTGAETDKKDAQLAHHRENAGEAYLTTDQGIRVSNTDNSLKLGERGPTLLEDFHFREKITRFDHERIPERVVHARGSAAHGYFQVYESLADLTRAKFLQDPSRKTPVFLRFSTVAGSRGSADTVRDVRGFAVKFYTDEGNFDLVGNNIPVFFIQDGIKFPDVIHAAKPEPDHEMPQAGTAHDSFWDFASLQTETTHMLMWAMSDRAIPRSYRMMEGFGVHTFRLVNAHGRSRFVKFHWKPLLGVHSLVWDEAQKLAGKDSDFHRRDLWEAIEKGNFPEWELGLQIVEEEDAEKLNFDLLDATKLIPEELVPVRRVGKLTLNRNPDNFFAETEQVAFCVSNLVPGIDVTDDPLMQARLFSYLDTQITRLGGPNFAQIPINKPVAPVDNHQQDGFHQHRIPTRKANYTPNSIGGGCPHLANLANGGYVHYPERVEGEKIRKRAETFADHFSQARLFWVSMSAPEKEHIVKAFRFELGKVEREEIRQRMIVNLTEVDAQLAKLVADGIGVDVQTALKTVGRRPGKPAVAGSSTSPSLSMENTLKTSVKTRKVAALVADGVSEGELKDVKTALESAGATVEVIGPRLGKLKSAEGGAVPVTMALPTTASVMFDAVFIPGGKASVEALLKDGSAIHFVLEAFKHHKTVGATGEGVDMLRAVPFPAVTLADAKGGQGAVVDQGVVTSQGAPDLVAFAGAFIQALAQHRHWDRPGAEAVPA
ncbi:catalase [Chondromyces apiculatus]|uniref:Catalase n=1 Tax=Chondromyces apiculatus DSM 436 TaxID=1192034 RepID=A0A017T5K6_9BACT|nr:catalase [Chondromyces apiculatus]EYF03861.1 Catalase [Chondromyces apiculatus DSM 436]